MQRCQCQLGCEAVIKTKGKLYARGHDPASHIFTRERKRRISKARRRFFANGGVSWWEGKHHSEESKEKLSKYHQDRPEEHNDHLRESVRKSKAHHQAAINNFKLASKSRIGSHHSKEAKRKIAKAVSKARRKQKWLTGGEFVKGQAPWNKGLTKETDKRVAALADNLVGHPLNISRFQSWYPNDEFKMLRMRSSWEVAFAHWFESLQHPLGI